MSDQLFHQQTMFQPNEYTQEMKDDATAQCIEAFQKVLREHKIEAIMINLVTKEGKVKSMCSATDGEVERMMSAALEGFNGSRNCDGIFNNKNS